MIKKPERRAMPGIALLVIAATLLIFGGIITIVSLDLRKQVRQQIISRDGAVLYPVALMALSQSEEEGLAGPLLDESDSLLNVALSTSRLKGVIAVRLFDGKGNFTEAVPFNFLKGALKTSDLAALREHNPVSHFHEQGRLSDYFFDEPHSEEAAPIPLLEVILPLPRTGETELSGIAQYLIEGEGIQIEFKELDHTLLRQAGILFGSGGVIISLILLWAFRRLAFANAILEERGRRLIEANAELSLAAKTSAIGSIAAHLIHGLKNPLSGLHEFVSNREGNEAAVEKGDWTAAAETADRMQRMVDEIVSVLREEESGADYDLTLSEIGNLIEGKAAPMAEKSGVRFKMAPPPEGRLDSRRGNLLILILMNLIQNGIEATPAGKQVQVSYSSDGRSLDCRVSDQGGGFSPAQRKTLFKPSQSTKEGGSGLGLAISHQLARQIGARLELDDSSPEGSVFSISISLLRKFHKSSG